MKRPRLILFDTSIYVASLRQSSATLSLRSLAGGGFVVMSAVVLGELFAGAMDRTSIRMVERLERDFSSARRMLTPSVGDWTQAGRVLARLVTKHGYDAGGLAKITNDVLIATSAARNGVTVVTLNARDFVRIAEFTPFQWREQLL